MNEKGRIALQEYQAKVASGEIERSERKSLKQKWKENPTSLRHSINYMCHQCFCGEDVVNSVRNCTDKKCALYQVRPYQ